MKYNLDLLFKPRNVVIFEAKEKLSYFIEGFKSQGFNLDNLYLITHLEESLFGIKCYRSIEEIPTDTIDLIIIAVKRDVLVQSLQDILAKKKINFIHIFTAGTGEFDEIGIKIEKQIKEILDKNSHTRAIGPNCMGVYCPSGHNAYLPLFPTKNGDIGLIYHSGDLLTRTIMYGNSRYHLTFSKGVSVGNCVNLQVTDFLDYFKNDNETNIISIYFEGFSQYFNLEGKKLFNLLKSIKKPVLFLRGGMTKRGQTAVLTHTGSLGTDEKIWDAIYKQTPLIKVGSSLDEMVDFLYIFHSLFKRYQDLPFIKQIDFYPKSKNALVILWSGGLGIIDTDTLTKLGISLPLFHGKTKEKLTEVYPIKVGSLSNPLDLPWVSRSEKYIEVCKTAITEDIDLVIMHTNAWGMRDEERFQSYYDNLKKIKKYIDSLNKLLIMILAETPHKIRNEYYELLIKDGFIVYPDLRRAAKAFLALYEYGEKLRRLK
jgi:acyl-CoA synthetase (NDP forming)